MYSVHEYYTIKTNSVISFILACLFRVAVFVIHIIYGEYNISEVILTVDKLIFTRIQGDFLFYNRDILGFNALNLSVQSIILPIRSTTLSLYHIVKILGEYFSSLFDNGLVGCILVHRNNFRSPAGKGIRIAVIFRLHIITMCRRLSILKLGRIDLRSCVILPGDRILPRLVAEQCGIRRVTHHRYNLMIPTTEGIDRRLCLLLRRRFACVFNFVVHMLAA